MLTKFLIGQRGTLDLGRILLIVETMGGGFAYEEAAEICGVAVGTIKSRVARGRVALEALLSDGALPSRREHDDHSGRGALETIMSQVDDLSREAELPSRDGAPGEEPAKR